MTRKKHLRRALVLALCLWLLARCDAPGPFPLSQSREQITGIELLYNDFDTPMPRFETICNIPPEQFPGFLDGLMALESRTNSMDPATGFGELVIRITYRNGDQDLIGNDNNAYVTGEKTDHDIYWFDNREFKAFFASYAGDAMPEEAMSWLK